MIEKAQAMMTEELLEETLHTKADVDPDNLATLLDLVAIGITNSTWRNSCVENWHAEGRLSEGDMMRINSHTTDAIRRRLARWTTEVGITSASGIALAEVGMEEVDAFTIRLFGGRQTPSASSPLASRSVNWHVLRKTSESMRTTQISVSADSPGKWKTGESDSAYSAQRAMALSPARVGGSTLPGQLSSGVTSPSSTTQLTLTGAPTANGAQGSAPSHIRYRTAPDCEPPC